MTFKANRRPVNTLLQALSPAASDYIMVIDTPFTSEAAFNRLTQVDGLIGAGFPYMSLGGSAGEFQSKSAYTSGSFTGNVAGNARLTGSYDLQVFRTSALNAATSARSFLCGKDNRIASTDTWLLGGSSNRTAATFSAVIGGNLNITSATNSAILGGQSHSTVSTATTILGGNTNTLGTNGIDGRSSVVMGSSRVKITTQSTIGQAGGRISADGDSQRLLITMHRSTTNATVGQMFIDNSSLQMALPNNTTWSIRGTVVARRKDADGENDAWDISAVIKRDANAASTTMVASTVTQKGASAWVVAVVADTTGGAFRVNITGAASKTIAWTGNFFVSVTAG